MPPLIKVTASGFKETEKSFNALTKNMQTRVVKRSTDQGGRLILNEARRLAPVGTYNRFRRGRYQTLRNSIHLEKVRSRRRGVRQVGTRITTEKEVFWSTFLELGTKLRGRRGRRLGILASTGRIEKGRYDFLRPAVRRYQRAITRIFIREVRAAVRRASSLKTR